MTKNLKGARGIKLLCLSSIALAAVAFGASSTYAQNQPIYNSPNKSAQTEIRMQQMETQIRELTGRVENQIYEINRLKQQVDLLKMAKPEPEPATVMEPPAENKPLNLGFKPPVVGGMKNAVPGGGTVDPTAQYEQAYANLKAKNYIKARAGFNGFLAEHQDHVLAPNARYWLGETHYVEGEYQRAAKIFAEAFKSSPDSAKAPDMLLKLGMSLAGMGNEKDACVAMSQVEVKFPTGHDNVIALAKREMEKIGCDI